MLVVFIHVGRPSIIGSPGWWIYQFTAEGISRIAVPFFFICSGYFLARHFVHKNWYAVEVGKRIKTLIVPYLLWSLIFYLFIYVLYRISPANSICWRMRLDVPVLTRILLATGLSAEKLPMLYPLWYIRFLFLLVLVSPAFAVKGKVLRCMLFVGMTALYLAFNPGDGSPVGIHIGFPFEGVLYFYIGIILNDESLKAYIKMLRRKYVFLIGGGVLILTRALLLRYGCGWVCFFKPVFIPLCILAVWFAVPGNAWSSRFTSLSFLVYVTHVFGLHLFSFLFGRDSDSALMLLERAGFGLCFAFGVSHFLKNVIGRRGAILWGGRE